MDEGFPFLDIIFLAMIAGFIALRLRSVLGRRTGHERRPGDRFGGADDTNAQDNIIQLPSANDVRRPGEAEITSLDIAIDSPLGTALSDITAADRNFRADTFVSGASAAYGMIIEAFAEGDLGTLRPLLSDDVFERFETAITDREARKRTAETKVIEIVTAEFDGAELNGSMAEITVKFEADLLNVTRDEEGTIVEGNASDAERVRESWTFARNVENRDPNWILIATQSTE